MNYCRGGSISTSEDSKYFNPSRQCREVRLALTSDLSPQSSHWLRAHPQTHDQGPSFCDCRPRRRLPSGCCNLCWRGKKVRAAPAQVQAFRRADGQTSGAAGFVNRRLSWLRGLHAPPVIMFPPKKGFYRTTFQLNERLSYFECCMSTALLRFLCIACTTSLYILYFSTEGHYGITKDCNCVFWRAIIALVCMWISETRGCTDVFKSVHFEIMTRDLGNNLNVFIVFYWNKSFKLFVSTLWKVHSQFWHQALRWTVSVTAYMIIFLGIEDIPTISSLTSCTDQVKTGAV